MKLRVERMGRIGYAPMLALQEARHAAVLADKEPDTLFLLEHDPVVTLGKNSGLDGADNLKRTPQELTAIGIELHRSSRGGDVTYHGPGQIVGYPIVKLRDGEKDIRRFIWNLEEVLIRTCAEYEVVACRVDGLRGVWVGNDKVAAIGVRVARWTTMHGFALNVSTDLAHFAAIVPCGIRGRGVTSLAALLGRAPQMVEVEDHLARHCSQVLNREPCRDVTVAAHTISAGRADTGNLDSPTGELQDGRP
jgi:lipoyl(octanoyl) transferase